MVSQLLNTNGRYKQVSGLAMFNLPIALEYDPAKHMAQEDTPVDTCTQLHQNGMTSSYVNGSLTNMSWTNSSIISAAELWHYTK